MDFAFQPTWSAAALAALAVAGGAPLFSDGLRALRLRRALPGLPLSELDDHPTGLIRIGGPVILDSPLFSPLSARPCAGYVLEVTGPSRPAARIEEHRPFRVAGGSVSARVLAQSGHWDLDVTDRREVAAGQPMTEQLERLFAGSPEARWLRAAGAPLVLTERALLAGHTCEVIGQARHARPFELPAEIELRATGTDDASRLDTVFQSGGTDPDLWIDGGSVEFVYVSDRPIEPGRHVPNPVRVLGTALGPVLSLLGLLYLAYAADAWRASGRF